MVKGKKKFPEMDYTWEIVKALVGREGSVYSISGDVKEKKNRITEIPQSTILRYMPKLEEQGLIEKVGLPIGKRRTQNYTTTEFGLLEGYRLKDKKGAPKITANEVCSGIKKCFKDIKGVVIDGITFKDVDVLLDLLLEIPKYKGYFYQRLNRMTFSRPFHLGTFDIEQFMPFVLPQVRGEQSIKRDKMIIIGNMFAYQLIDSFLWAYRFEKWEGKEKEEEFKKMFRKAFNSEYKKDIFKRNLELYLKQCAKEIKVKKEYYKDHKKFISELIG